MCIRDSLSPWQVRYRVQGETDESIVGVPGGTVTSRNTTSLRPVTTYIFTVVARNEGGEDGDPSDEMMITTDFGGMQ